jgi:hypothetical protein
MDSQYLEELITEVKNRGGGMVLNLQNRPEVVVLTVCHRGIQLAMIHFQFSSNRLYASI